MRFTLAVVLLALCMLCAPALGAAPDIDWETSYGVNNYNEFAVSMVPLAGGGVLICGYNDYDLWVAEVSDSGAQVWDDTYGGENTDAGHQIAATGDGGWIIVGATKSLFGDVSGNHGEFDIWVAKLKSDRTIDWQLCLGGTDIDVGRSVIQTSDGGYLVTGKASSPELPGYTGTGWYDGYIAKILPDGTLDWEQCYGDANHDGFIDAIETSDGGYLVRGYTIYSDAPGYHGDWDLWILKIGPSGVIDWEQCYGGSDMDINLLYEFGAGLIECPDGYIVLATTESSDGDLVGTTPRGATDIWILKIDKDDRSILNQARIGGEYAEHTGTIRTVSSGGFILVGTTRSSGGDVSGNHPGAAYASDIWVVRLAPDLSIVWQKCLGGSNEEFGFDVLEITPGTFEIVGHTLSDDGDVTLPYTRTSGWDGWVVRLENDGSGGTAVPEFPGILIPGTFLGIIGCAALILRRRA
jgi:hypothetical protein